MRFNDRLRKLEEAVPERRPCPVCGAADARAVVYIEEHELDGSVTYSSGQEPCWGCQQIEAERSPDVVRGTIICHLHTYGLSCPICKASGAESEAELASRRERFEMGHPAEAVELYAKYGEE